MYLPSDSRGHYYELDFNKWLGGGGGALFKSLPGPLFTSDLGPWLDMALV